MKRALILTLIALMGGISVYGGVESGANVVAAGSSSDVSTSADGLSAMLRLSHETVKTGIVVALSASEVTGASIVLYEWDLDGDGTYDEATESSTFAHAFADDGIYGVRVRVTDEEGATAEAEAGELVVLNRAPTAGFSFSSTASNDVAAHEFANESTDDDGEIVGWHWDFGDGKVSSEANPAHTYADDGTYSVTLVVVDDDGGESSSVIEVLVVSNAQPVAAFSLATGSIAAGESVSFVDESIDPSPNGSIVHVGWDFGDGAYRAGGPSADGVYVHTYETAGTFTVTLYVIDDDGGMSFVRQTISVS